MTVLIKTIRLFTCFDTISFIVSAWLRAIPGMSGMETYQYLLRSMLYQIVIHLSILNIPVQ